MKKTFIIFMSLVLAFAASATLGAGLSGESDIVRGAVVCKITSDNLVDLPVDGADRMGIEQLDRFMDEIGATWIERKFPHCNPPKPGGTDLTRIYNLYFPESISVNDVVRDMSRLDVIEWVEPWYRMVYHMEYNDERYDEQWIIERIDADHAHDISTGDRRVAVAIVDTGIDMDHEDLEDNLWINPGEDLNGDGEITRNEHNNEDDDDNGYVDDFYGWDFEGRDNYPDDPGGGQAAGHGSHCAGIASAVTNNETGIASVGYACGIMPVRSGEQFGPEGIVYAATTGAKVISCSWGPPMPQRVIEEAVDYAYENDALVVAAAGNLGMFPPETRVYPAAYEHAVAVAGTDPDDRIWEGSNYGNWVNISAPGEDILSCILNNSYEVHSGTSMATPLVAGAAVLIRATYPQLNVDETLELLYEGADDIDDLNNQYRGKLGVGRININNSLQLGPMATVEIGDLEIVSDNNDNGKLDPGETVELAITISYSENAEEAIEEIAVTLICENEALTVENPEFWIDELEPGGEASNMDEPFVVQISEDALATTTWLFVMVESEPAELYLEEGFETVIGHPEILVIDDDGGANVDETYIAAVYRMNRGWQRWDIATMEEPPAVEMFDNRSMTIWLTGDEEGTLSDIDKWILANTIETGSNILLIGEYIGDDTDNKNFLRDYFGALHQANRVRATLVRGYDNGSPFSADVQMILDDEEGGSDSPSSMVAVNGAGALANYVVGDDEIGVAGVYRNNPDNETGTIYLGFAFEAIIDEENLTSKHEALSLMYDWFTGEHAVSQVSSPVVESFSLEPAYPNPFNSVIRLDFSLPVTTEYRLTICDISGRLVSELGVGALSAGRYRTVWDARDFSSGVYIARLTTTGRETLKRRLVLVK